MTRFFDIGKKVLYFMYIALITLLFFAPTVPALPDRKPLIAVFCQSLGDMPSHFSEILSDTSLSTDAQARTLVRDVFVAIFFFCNVDFFDFLARNVFPQKALSSVHISFVCKPVFCLLWHNIRQSSRQQWHSSACLSLRLISKRNCGFCPLRSLRPLSPASSFLRPCQGACSRLCRAAQGKPQAYQGRAHSRA